MKNRIFTICSTACFGAALLLSGCLSFEEEEPMPPDAKIIPAPAPDSQALASSGPTLSQQTPALTTTTTPKFEDPQFKPLQVPQTPKTVKKTTTPAKKSATTVKTTGSQTYVVKKNDSYWKIARMYGVSYKTLQAANKDAKLYPGKKIIIPAGATAKAVTAKKTKVSAKAAPAVKATGSETVYVVKSGDNFSKIAKRYGVRASDIAALNGIPLTKMLQVGQKLRIPARGAKTTKAAAKNTSAKKSTAKQTSTTKQTSTPKAEKEKIQPKPEDDTLPDVPETPAVPDVKDTPAVPAAPAAPAAQTAPATPAAPAAQTAHAAPAAPAAPAAQSYDIQLDKDYSFEELAKKYGCTVAELKNLNPQVTGNVVPKGTSFKLP